MQIKEFGKMDELSQVFKEMDFQFFGSGEHGMSIDGMRKVLNNDHFVFLDVRTHEEVKGLIAPSEDMALVFKPGPLSKM
jgi:hypothetical protein